MPRFVILAHDWPTPHLDLLLEAGKVLKAWRLRGEPGREPVPAEPNIDHRRFYLDYEGPLSGGRGTVARWEAGTYDGEIGEGGWTVTLNGQRLRGTATMACREGGWVFTVL